MQQFQNLMHVLMIPYNYIVQGDLTSNQINV